MAQTPENSGTVRGAARLPVDLPEPQVRGLLDALPVPLALLDRGGRVLLANQAWRGFAPDGASGPTPQPEGASYLDGANGSGDSATLAERLRDLLQGRGGEFAFDHLFPAPGDERQFRARVTPVPGGGPVRALVAYENVTEARRAEEALHQSEARAGQLEQEIRVLQEVIHFPPASVTAQLFGMGSLQQAAPETFHQLVEEYAGLLDLAMDERAYRVNRSISEQLRTISDRLGFLRAGPRDVVEIHSRALQAKTTGTVAAKRQAYYEEGRLLVLELMGHLVSYYRVNNSGLRPEAPPAPPGRDERKRDE